MAKDRGWLDATRWVTFGTQLSCIVFDGYSPIGIEVRHKDCTFCCPPFLCLQSSNLVPRSASHVMRHIPGSMYILKYPYTRLMASCVTWCSAIGSTSPHHYSSGTPGWGVVWQQSTYRLTTVHRQSWPVLEPGMTPVALLHWLGWREPPMMPQGEAEGEAQVQQRKVLAASALPVCVLHSVFWVCTACSRTHLFTVGWIADVPAWLWGLKKAKRIQ